MTKRDTLSRLKQQERQLREDLIIEAARTVFGAKTYDQVSMNEIAKAAGIAKSSIYTYFPNQEALFVETAYRDTQAFVASLKQLVEGASATPVKALIDGFLDYSIAHDAHWRMITHFALHGNISPASGAKLNRLSIQIMDLLETVLRRVGCREDKRLLAHTLFAALSGILISFRKYPGRSEAERIAHMKRIAGRVEAMLLAYIAQSGC
ncbi:MAG: TetR/AcrR family transcriptional regulator [Desulfosarcinaceae bacterium]|nr:TetR/AcrR family transcriptional regulator [Desulfosarcinaceae bacterium]